MVFMHVDARRKFYSKARLRTIVFAFAFFVPGYFSQLLLLWEFIYPKLPNFTIGHFRVPKTLTFKRRLTLVPEVFLDFSSRKRSRASREAATTSHESDEEREKNLWLPWPRISLSCRRQLSNASNC